MSSVGRSIMSKQAHIHAHAQIAPCVPCVIVWIEICTKWNVLTASFLTSEFHMTQQSTGRVHAERHRHQGGARKWQGHAGPRL